MILTIMGMEVHPFDRLARAVDELAAERFLGEDYFVQSGACTYQLQHCRSEQYLSFHDLCEKIDAATVVITHAGAGSTLTCIQQGKHPIMAPRRSAFGEHVDEHQLPFADKMSEAGYATVVHDMGELRAAIRSTMGRSASIDPSANSQSLTTWLEDFWDGLKR